jgi:heme oxygenase
MNIAQLVKLAENRLTWLSALHAEASRVGDADALAQIEQDQADTQNTLTALLQLI